MFNMFFLWLGALGRTFQTRQNLILENLALRQQLAVLKRRHPRPRLSGFDKLFWVVVRRWWSGWKNALIVVTPETVVRWHRAGFHWYWRMICKVRNPVGRRPTSKEVRGLIFQMVADNPTWGAPRVHGELLMLGFDVSERTISRWVKRLLCRLYFVPPRRPDPSWPEQGNPKRSGFLGVDRCHPFPCASGWSAPPLRPSGLAA